MCDISLSQEIFNFLEEKKSDSPGVFNKLMNGSMLCLKFKC